MKHDRRPPGSRSPFEFTGNARHKRDRAAAKADVAGAIMTNSNTSGSDFPSKPPKEVLSYMEKAINEAFLTPFSGEFSVSIGGHEFPVSNVRFNGEASRSSGPVDPQRRRLAEEEARLRPAVAKWLLKAAPGVAWDDVIGNDTARQHLVEAIEHPVRHADLYRHYGKKPTKGVLLYGPPGCGKTMFGKAAASVLAQLHGTRSASFLSLKGPEIQSVYVGMTEERIRAIFAYARAYKALHGHALVIFIDEADAILPSRDGAGGRRVHSYEESQVATFLAEMDGIEDSGALVILATNRPEAIDAAILRDGRIDRKIRVERPTQGATAAILERALQGVPLAPDCQNGSDLAQDAAEAVFGVEQVVADLCTDRGQRFVRLSDIVNGAMLVGLVEQAKGNAFRRDLAAGGAPSGIARQDLMLAIDAILKQNRGLNHLAAIQEMGARDGFSVAHVVPQASAPPRYTLDAAGDVVRLQ